MQALGLVQHYDLVLGLGIFFLLALLLAGARPTRLVAIGFLAMAALWAGLATYSIWHMVVDHGAAESGHHLRELLLAVAGATLVLGVVAIVQRRARRGSN